MYMCSLYTILFMCLSAGFGAYIAVLSSHIPAVFIGRYSIHIMYTLYATYALYYSTYTYTIIYYTTHTIIYYTTHTIIYFYTIVL